MLIRYVKNKKLEDNVKEKLKENSKENVKRDTKLQHVNCINKVKKWIYLENKWSKISLNLFIMMIISIPFLLTGCKNSPTDTAVKTTPIVGKEPIESAPLESPKETNTSYNNNNQTSSPTNTNTNAVTTSGDISDYFPFLQDTELYYEGEGNEYASFRTYTDFIDQDKNRIQIRTNNGGSETVQVIQCKDGVLSILYSKNECYYRDNFINTISDTNSSKDYEILLKEPLEVGTKWTLSDKRERYISGTNVDVDTDLEHYKAIEVTTKDDEGITKDYYVKDVGLVKRTYETEGLIVKSTLAKRSKKVPFKQVVPIYYVENTSDNKENAINKDSNSSSTSNNNSFTTKEKTLSFYTNDITRSIFQKALVQVWSKGEFPVIDQNTKLNSMYLGEDNIAYVDFSNSIIDNMNALKMSLENEKGILQSIANTFGGYYGVSKVYITVNQKPYKSNNITLGKGDTFKVNVNVY